MIKIEVFHAAFEATPEHVASLTSAESVESALEHAFAGTQNLETSWVESRGQRDVRVEPTESVLKRQGCRSTSVGDYVRITDAQGRESFYRCCGCGWSLITDRSELAKVGPSVVMAAYGMGSLAQERDSIRTDSL